MFHKKLPLNEISVPFYYNKALYTANGNTVYKIEQERFLCLLLSLKSIIMTSFPNLSYIHRNCTFCCLKKKN
jgi:hypothetical protein